MADDIVTRLRWNVEHCQHGNQRYYNGPEGIEVRFATSCSNCEAWRDCADEIERLREKLKQREADKSMYLKLSQEHHELNLLCTEAYATAWNAVIGYINDWCNPSKDENNDEYQEYRFVWEMMDALRAKWEARFQNGSPTGSPPASTVL